MYVMGKTFHSMKNVKWQKLFLCMHYLIPAVLILYYAVIFLNNYCIIIYDMIPAKIEIY